MDTEPNRRKAWRAYRRTNESSMKHAWIARRKTGGDTMAKVFVTIIDEAGSILESFAVEPLDDIQGHDDMALAFRIRDRLEVQFNVTDKED
ncbi:MAG TPA: hypothetical protein VGJ20_01870 [Xanthobacteraceae bacterium]|jgi:hypothetical protein